MSVFSIGFNILRPKDRTKMKSSCEVPLEKKAITDECS